jgi:hypothetical protein
MKKGKLKKIIFKTTNWIKDKARKIVQAIAQRFGMFNTFLRQACNTDKQITNKKQYTLYRYLIIIYYIV